MKKIKLLFIVFSLCLGLVLVSCGGECEHDYEVSKVNIEVTCTTDGEVEKKCTKCGETKIEVVEATGHDIEDVTCLHVKHCIVCFEEFGTELADHQYGEWEVYRASDCETSGSERRRCTYCNKLESRIIAPLGHDYSDWTIIKQGSCSEAGLRQKECAHCHDIIEEEITAGHQFGEWVILQNSTCQNVGLRSHQCTQCDHIEREEIPTSDHTYIEWELKDEPTCTNEGTEQSKCEHCDSIKLRPIDCIDHNFGEWTVESEASCSSYGVKYHQCTMCETIEQELIEILEHEYVEENGKMVCKNCHNENDVYTLLKEVFDKLEITIDNVNGINLPLKIESYPVVWKSYNPNVALDDGTVYADMKGETVVYTATITVDDYEIVFKKELVIPYLNTNDIDWCWNTYYSKKIPDSAASQINYLWKEYAGICSVVDYVSNNTDALAHNGEVYQQVYDQYATVTCYLQVGKLIKSYSRDITILGFTPNQCLEKVVEWLPTVIDQLATGQIDRLPLTHELWGTSISWFSLEAGVVAGNGVFVKPYEQKDITLQCTVSSGTYNRDLEFMIEGIGGNISKLDQLKEWMKGQIPSRILGTTNFVLENDAFEYQIRTNDNGVLNLIDGQLPEIDRSLLIDTTKNTWVNRYWGSGTFNTDYHPAVTQEILDRMLYTGYQNPNPQNILWITVHESGMPRVGNDAKLLADIQMQTALGQRDRAASWNYQVDENKIYQSFEDEIICWHAGDGTATLGNGNNNSIGIEMCINEDGNYDGAMHMDAKLIAMLLHKYNLTLQNVKRHYDWSGKQCPYYMIEVGRWNEFLNLVDKEYTAMSLLQDAKVTWTVTTDDNDNTEEVLNTYFTKGGSTLWFSKQVYEKVTLHITMTVEYEGEIFTHSNDLTLYPNV